MPLRYADRHPREEKVPECFGRDAYFDPKCSECRRCHLEYECRDEIHSRKGTPIPVRRVENTTYAPTPGRVISNMPSRRGPDDRTHAGIIQENETAFERFMKDCLTGACRGFFEEGSDFFRFWRW
jgi:hypothetical protein